MLQMSTRAKLARPFSMNGKNCHLDANSYTHKVTTSRGQYSNGNGNQWVFVCTHLAKRERLRSEAAQHLVRFWRFVTDRLLKPIEGTVGHFLYEIGGLGDGKPVMVLNPDGDGVADGCTDLRHPLDCLCDALARLEEQRVVVVRALHVADSSIVLVLAAVDVLAAEADAGPALCG